MLGTSEIQNRWVTKIIEIYLGLQWTTVRAIMYKCRFGTVVKPSPLFEVLPAINAVDIINYLVLQTSFCSRQMKTYKSLEEHNFFVSVRIYDFGTKVLRNAVQLKSFLGFSVWSICAITANAFGERMLVLPTVHVCWKQLPCPPSAVCTTRRYEYDVMYKWPISPRALQPLI